MSAFVVPRSNFSPKRREKSIGAFRGEVFGADFGVGGFRGDFGRGEVGQRQASGRVCERYVIRFDVGEGHCAVRGRDGQLFFEFQVSEFYVAVG